MAGGVYRDVAKVTEKIHFHFLQLKFGPIDLFLAVSHALI